MSTTTHKFRPFSGVEVSFEKVGPRQAKAMLDGNTRNRSLSHLVVEAYARSMTARDWPFTGDPIRIGPDGIVLDGQHRLHAIEESGVTLWLIVIRGLPLETQKYMDGGKKRNPANQLAIQGVKNSSAHAAAARLMLQWRHWCSKRASIQPGNPEIVEYAIENGASISDGVERAGHVYRELSRKVSKPAVAVAFMRAVDVSDIFTAHAWFELLATSDGLRSGEPLHTLRRRFINADKADAQMDLYLITRTWNATIAGEGLSTLQPPKRGVTVATFPDMRPPEREDVSETAEEAAEMLQRMRERSMAKKVG